MPPTLNVTVWLMVSYPASFTAVSMSLSVVFEGSYSI